MVNNEVLIIGAGPAGMGASFELHKAGMHFIIIEKNNTVGGLARTLRYGEFMTDIGPHRLFTQKRYLYELLSQLLKGHLLKAKRFTRFYTHGKFFLYPIDIKNALSNVGLYKGLTILFDYIWQRIKKRSIHTQPDSFAEQIVLDFGRSLAEFNILRYTEKIWGMQPSRISSEWARQRIEGLSLSEVIKNALFRTKEKPRSLIEWFYYPDTGNGLIYEKLKEEFFNKGVGEMMFNTYPVKLFHNNRKVTSAVVNTGGLRQNIRLKYLISSIPITEFVGLLEPGVPDDILTSSRRLRFRSHISLFITLNRAFLFPDHWIYFPDREIPFCRIASPANFSKYMCPSGKSSVLIEFFCWYGDRMWHAPKEKLLIESIPWLEKLWAVKREDIMESFLHKERYAYPVYDLNYRRNLEDIMRYLRRFENLWMIGRGGAFRYNNQDDALEMGISAAREILKNEKVLYPAKGINSGGNV